MSFDIKTRRKELGLTLEELSERVGVSVATVSRWERGDIKSFKASNIAPLAKALEVSPVELLSISPSLENNIAEQVFSTDDHIYYSFDKNHFFVYPDKTGNFPYEKKDVIFSLLEAWHKATEREKLTAAVALGFDYDPKEDPPAQ